jgi:hypothetical protein
LFLSNPSEVRAGDIAALTLKVWNKGSSIAKDVTLLINDTDYLDVSFDSSNVVVGDINSKESTNVQVNLRVSNDASIGLYNLPIKVLYDDDDGLNYQSNQSINVELTKEAIFEVVEVQNPQLLNSDSRRQVTIYFRNKGTRAAEDVRFTMLAKYPFIPTGRSFFIDLVGVNETIPVTFEISVDDEAGTQAYPVDVQIEWLENDESFSEIERFSLSVTRVPSMLPWISIILVVAVIAIMYYLNKRTQY